MVKKVLGEGLRLHFECSKVGGTKIKEVQGDGGVNFGHFMKT